MRTIICLFVCLVASLPMQAESSIRVLIRDISSVEGIRENALVGYGLVVGLNGTGDRRQTMFTTQTLSSVLQRMGVQVSPASMRVNNVAAVFVTASLPAFARSGIPLDITVSSIGDAKSLEGGLLLLTTLRGPDGEVYATAQGPVTTGGYSAGGAGNSKQVNHPTVARIPAGALVERDAPTDLSKLSKLCLLINKDDFSTAQAVASAINAELDSTVAEAVDGRRVEIPLRSVATHTIPELLNRIQMLSVNIRPKAKVVVNERTGTVVIGSEVRLGAASILHGSLHIEISTQFGISQPESLSQGQTAPIAQPTVNADAAHAKQVDLKEGATVQDLVAGLQAIGATTRDIISILQALKVAGALQADLEVI